MFKITSSEDRWDRSVDDYFLLTVSAAVTLFSTANCLLETDDIYSAKSYYESILKQFIFIYGINTTLTAFTHFNLAKTYFFEGSYGLALLNLKSAGSIFWSTYGEDSLEYIVTCVAIAELCEKTGDYEESIIQYTRAHQGLSGVSYQSERSEILLRLLPLYLKMNRFSDAVRCRHAALLLLPLPQSARTREVFVTRNAIHANCRTNLQYTFFILKPREGSFKQVL